MTYKTITTLIILSFAGFHSVSVAQSTDEASFQQQYNRADLMIDRTCDSLKSLISEMKMNDSLSEIHKAKINHILTRLQTLEDMIITYPPPMIIPSDSTGFSDSLISTAQNFIIQSRPDEGIPLILKFLEQIDKSSGTAIFARIYLADAYRQKQEYDKGIALIYEILGSKNISEKNKAFALNRMAALMNEKKTFKGNRADSVSKYSRLCIEISAKNKLTEYLALSQNELGNNYLRLNMPDSALMLISEAANNFLSIQKYPQTINTYLNLSRIYSNLGDLEKSKAILLRALEFGNLEENRNLFKYVYYYLAELSFKSGDYMSAYDYQKISYRLMTRFFDDRIQQQINEMSAKYDLHEKEAKIKEEVQKSRSYRLQVKYLITISAITLCLLLVLVVLFRFKNRAYKKLVEQNLKSMKLEKEVELCLRNLSENDIRIKVDPDDRNSELALRFEKFLSEEKPYLWSEVSLDEFCKKLNTNRTYLSKLINDKYHMGFYDLLFEYRIRTAKEYLNDSKYKHISVEGIGEMTGFKSNSNFYKRFKNVVGMTPNQFRELALKSEKHFVNR